VFLELALLFCLLIVVNYTHFWNLFIKVDSPQNIENARGKKQKYEPSLAKTVAIVKLIIQQISNSLPSLLSFDQGLTYLPLPFAVIRIL
jgi:hypothetical protein